MRTLRRYVTIAAPIVGMILVFAAILLPSISLDLQLQVFVALAGILLIEAGVWGLTAKILPSERRFLDLRAEVDNFIELVRNLNTRGVALKRSETPEAKAAFEQARAALNESVERMADVAGKETELN